MFDDMVIMIHEIEFVSDAGMTMVANLFAQALRFHQQGELAEAESLYRQILAAEPNHADTLHLLGFLEHQRGRSELAADMIRQAITLNPKAAACHSNLGIVLMDQGLLEEATDNSGRRCG